MFIVRGGDVKQTLHLPQIKVFLPWCREMTCPDVFTAAFLQTGDRELRDLWEVSSLPLKSVRMIPLNTENWKVSIMLL